MAPHLNPDLRHALTGFQAWHRRMYATAAKRGGEKLSAEAREQARSYAAEFCSRLLQAFPELSATEIEMETRVPVEVSP